jgi:hypothetical protein
MAVTAMVQHHVADYDAWRKAYDEFATAQKTGGVTRQSVYRSNDDPNNLLVTHGFATTADAETFLGHRAARRDAAGRPRASGSHVITGHSCVPLGLGEQPERLNVLAAHRHDRFRC